MIDISLIWNSLPALFEGTGLSLLITGISSLIGLVWGTVLAFGEASNKKSVRAVVIAYVTLFRGTPMLVQILFVFYVLPQLGLMIPAFWAATLAIGLNSAAYISQVIRSGINAVSRGQIEASYTLGFSKSMTLRYIVFPQAFRTVLPSLGNELITLIKDSSLASIIGVMELTKQASIIRSQTYDSFSILLAIACIYLLLTSTLAYCLKNIEKKVSIHV